MLCWGLMQARRDYISQRNIKPVYCYSISVTPIMGKLRNKTQNVVQFIELNWCESTVPSTRIPRYIPWKHTFLIRLIYPACCRRRVTVLSSSPLSHGIGCMGFTKYSDFTRKS